MPTRRDETVIIYEGQVTLEIYHTEKNSKFLTDVQQK